MRAPALFLLLAALLAPLAATAQHMGSVPALSGNTPFTTPPRAPPVAKPITDDVRRMRNYPEQPPVIPHAIYGYQVTLNANRCLACHSRQYTQGFGAPMISVTHFMDRDSRVLADVTPRRYFCLQCDVTPTDSPPLVPNHLRDAATMGRQGSP